MSPGLAVFTAVAFGVQFLLVSHALPGLASDPDDRPVITAATLTLAGGAPVLWALVVVRTPPLPEPGLLHPAAIAVLFPFAVSGVADPALTRVLSYEGIERIGPTISSAILAASPAVAAVVAILVLGETVTVATGVGIILVVLGVATLQVVQRSPTGGAAPDFLRRRLQHARPTDVLYPAAGAVLIGLAFVIVKLGFRTYDNALVATATAQTAALAVLLPVALRRWVRRRNRGRRRAIGTRRAILVTVVAGVVLATGWFSMFLALRAGTVVTVLPIVSTYPLVVAVGSAAIERELPRSPLLVASVVAIVAGAALVQVT